MKKCFALVAVLLVCTSMLFMEGCKKDPEENKDKAAFSGKVINVKNEPVPEATVDVNGTVVTTSNDGEFKIAVDNSNRYVINIKKRGYGLHSQVVFGSTEKREFILYPATEAEVDPTQEIRVTDTNSTIRPGSFSSQVDWATAKVVPMVYDAAGKLVDFGLPADILTAANYAASRKEAGPGISITIPGNSLESSGSAPDGKVTVALSTIDLFSVNSMPGDWSVEPGKERSSFMVSFGAGTIEIYDDKNQYQLKQGATAELSIPVDKSQSIYGSDTPKSIPLFVYNEKTGYWNVEGDSAYLNADKSAYVAKLKHFSAFNMDFEKTNPACLTFRYNSVGATTLPVYHVEALIPSMGTFIHRQSIISDPGGATKCQENANGTGKHMFYNLPGTSNICLIFYEPSPTLKPISMIVMPTAATYGANPPPACTQPNCTDCATYSEPANNCDDAGVCTGYTGCTFQTWARQAGALVGTAVKQNATTIKVKWVFTGAGSPTFEVWTADNSVGACADIANVTSAITSTAIYGGYTMREITLTPGAGTYTYKIKAGADEICLDPVTLP